MHLCIGSNFLALSFNLLSTSEDTKVTGDSDPAQEIRLGIAGFGACWRLRSRCELIFQLRANFNIVSKHLEQVLHSIILAYESVALFQVSHHLI